jgi:hypothetical protein
MSTTWADVALVLLPVVVGAVVSVVPTLFLERQRDRAGLRTRWDPTLEQVCASFAAGVRRIVDLAQVQSEGLRQSAAALREEHVELQRLMAEIRLLAAPPVQLAARRVVRHAWALQAHTLTGIDPRAADFPALSPRERTLSSLLDFYLAARRQLQIPDAANLVPLNPPIDDEHHGFHPASEEAVQ